MIKLNKKGQFVKGGKSWKGGRHYDAYGYVRIWKPDHPSANQGYIKEHRLVMEKKLGRMLKREEIVHHINHIKDDNRPENLMLINSLSEHKKLHPNFLTKETKEKIGKALLGHKVSNETRKKLSNWHKGKHLSEKTKQKISRALKGKKYGNTFV